LPVFIPAPCHYVKLYFSTFLVKKALNLQMPQVSATTRPSNIPTLTTVTLSSSHFEDGDGKAGAEMKVLFHILMDNLFSDEILAKSIAFGKTDLTDSLCFRVLALHS
jgi:hypothetical protein